MLFSLLAHSPLGSTTLRPPRSPHPSWHGPFFHYHSISELLISHQLLRVRPIICLYCFITFFLLLLLHYGIPPNVNTGWLGCAWVDCHTIRISSFCICSQNIWYSISFVRPICLLNTSSPHFFYSHRPIQHATLSLSPSPLYQNHMAICTICLARV